MKIMAIAWAAYENVAKANINNENVKNQRRIMASAKNMASAAGDGSGRRNQHENSGSGGIGAHQQWRK